MPQVNEFSWTFSSVIFMFVFSVFLLILSPSFKFFFISDKEIKKIFFEVLV